MRYLPILALALIAGCTTANPATSVYTQNVAADETLQADRAYKVLDVLGIGPKYAEKLAAVGVRNTEQLLEATNSRQERMQLAKSTGIPYGNVLHLARKVELMRIHGVGVRHSNLLEAVGVDSIKELAQRKASHLHDRLVFANHISRPFVKVDPSLSMVTRWIKDAADMLSAGRAITE